MIGLRRWKVSRIIGAAFLCAGFGLGASTGTSQASTSTVATCALGQPYSLDTLVNSAPAGATINFGLDCFGANAISFAGATSSVALEIANNLTIDATGHTIVLDGGNNGTSEGSSVGFIAGISVDPGVTFVLHHVVVQNFGTLLGTVYNAGNTSVYDTEFTQNLGVFAGGIENDGGSTLVSDSTFTGNLGLLGGAIVDDPFESETSEVIRPALAQHARSVLRQMARVPMMIRRMTFHVEDSAPTVVVANSTITGNLSLGDLESSGEAGGAALTEAAGDTMTVKSTTIANNDVYPTFFDPGDVEGLPATPYEPAAVSLSGQISFANSIVSGSGPYGDCDPSTGTIVDLGYNLEDDTPTTPQPSCGFSVANHDKVGVNPNLLPLANNGGLTRTMALPSVGAGGYPSPAMDTGACMLASVTLPTIDQRGTTRPQGPGCDMGAYELVQTGTTKIVLQLQPPFTKFNSSHIGLNGAPLGIVTVAQPLYVWVTNTNGLTADSVIVATAGNNTEFFTGFTSVSQPSLTIYANYNTMENVLISNRVGGFLGTSGTQTQTYTKLTNDWNTVESSIKGPYTLQATRLLNVKTFACDVSAYQTGGKITTSLGTQLQTFAGQAYTALGGSFKGTTLC